MHPLPDLVTIALDSSEPLEVRVQAAYAINRLDDRQFKQQLRPLLDIPRTEDPQLELFGNTLRALWPADLSAVDLFTRLRHRHEHFAGAHTMFMSHYLVDGLTPSDLPVALKWVEQQPPEHEHDFDFARLVEDILAKAWQHLDDPNVLTAFADAAVARLEKYDHVPSERRDRDDDVDWTNTEKRHVLLRALVPRIGNRLDSAATIVASETQLVTPADLPWLLEQLNVTQDATELGLWASLIAMIFGGTDDPDRISLVLRVSATNTVLQREIAPLVGPIALDSPEAEALRARHNRARQRAEDLKKRVTHPPLPAIVAGWLQRFEAGDVNAWWRLTLDMTLINDSDRYPPQVELNPDLTDLPTWEELDEPTKGRVIDAARVYIAKGEPDTAKWLGTNTFHRPAMAGYKAIRLLFDQRPIAVDGMTTVEWRKWAPTVVAYPESPDAEAQTAATAVLCRAYAQAATETIDAATVLLDKDAEQGHAYILHRFDECWDDRLAVAVLDHVKGQSAYPPTALQEVLDYVLQRPIEAAREFALGLISSATAGDELAERRRIAAATALMRTDARRVWPVVWPMVQSDDAFGHALFLHFASNTESRRGSSFMQELPEQDLADLYEWLSKAFPHREDPPVSGFVGDRHNVAMFRDAVLEVLKQRGTAASVRAIRSLAGRVPQVSWLRFVAIEARRIQLRHDWEALSPSELFKLAIDDRSRLISGGSQLLDAVIESLDRLETRLQGETGEVFALWDEISKRPKTEERLSDYIKNHLDDDLRKRGVVVNREVEVKKGNETDIHISAVKQLPDGSYDTVKAIIEVKGCWHPNVRKAMKEQLLDRYLVGTGNEHGLYVVGWFLCDIWDPTDNRRTQTPKWDLHAAAEQFGQQARTLSTTAVDVRTYVLDARLQ